VVGSRQKKAPSVAGWGLPLGEGFSSLAVRPTKHEQILAPANSRYNLPHVMFAAQSGLAKLCCLIVQPPSKASNCNPTFKGRDKQRNCDLSVRVRFWQPEYNCLLITGLHGTLDKASRLTGVTNSPFMSPIV